MDTLLTNSANTPDSPRRFLLGLIHEAAEGFLLNNPVLEEIQRGEVTRERWRDFAIQRYLSALSFENLLCEGIRCAEDVGYPELTNVIGDNLNDERGIDDKGIEHEERAHHVWRRDFYLRLGITEHDLEKSTPSKGTKIYRDCLAAIINSEDPLTIAGALLVLEGTIPVEFRKMKEGCDKTFGELFIEAKDDDAATRDTKAKARLYLEDHIRHDAVVHFPDLLKALEPHATSPLEKYRIRDGARTIINAKRLFYEDFK